MDKDKETQAEPDRQTGEESSEQTDRHFWTDRLAGFGLGVLTDEARQMGHRRHWKYKQLDGPGQTDRIDMVRQTDAKGPGHTDTDGPGHTSTDTDDPGQALTNRDSYAQKDTV